MNDTHNNAANEAANDEVWPRKLNKVLIGVGVLAFGLIIADRLVNMFRADDLPDTVEIVRDTKATDMAAAEPVEPELVDETVVAGANTMSASNTTLETGADAPQNLEEAIGIEDVFGSRLMFVSASEPMYIVTGDERRIDIGGEIDEQTTLAGITNQQVILDKDGDLLVISLPEPTASQ